jgi:hypothetical protein
VVGPETHPIALHRRGPICVGEPEVLSDGDRQYKGGERGGVSEESDTARRRGKKGGEAVDLEAVAVELQLEASSKVVHGIAIEGGVDAQTEGLEDRAVLRDAVVQVRPRNFATPTAFTPRGEGGVDLHEGLEDQIGPPADVHRPDQLPETILSRDEVKIEDFFNEFSALKRGGSESVSE